MAKSNTLAVIIPAYNAAKTLEPCLHSLANQSRSAQEVWLIDDGSTDATLEVAAKFPFVSLLKQHHRGPAAARNLAAKHSHCRILAFIDADMIVHPETLEKLIAPIVAGTSKGTFVKTEYVHNWHNHWAKAWNWHYTKSKGQSRLPSHHPDTAPVFRAILKEEFDRVGGFDSAGYNDDWSLSQKLGYLATNAPGAIIYHRNPGSLGEIWNQATWVAKRRYKGGAWGRHIAFVRALLPFSLLTGVIGTLGSGLVWYLPFKIVYDAAILWGIMQYWRHGRHEK